MAIMTEKTSRRQFIQLHDKVFFLPKKAMHMSQKITHSL